MKIHQYFGSLFTLQVIDFLYSEKSPSAISHFFSGWEPEHTSHIGNSQGNLFSCGVAKVGLNPSNLLDSFRIVFVMDVHEAPLELNFFKKFNFVKLSITDLDVGSIFCTCCKSFFRKAFLTGS